MNFVFFPRADQDDRPEAKKQSIASDNIPLQVSGKSACPVCGNGNNDSSVQDDTKDDGCCSRKRCCRKRCCIMASEFYTYSKHFLCGCFCSLSKKIFCDPDISQKQVGRSKFIRLRSENVTTSHFQLKNVIAEISATKSEQAARQGRQHTILSVSIIMQRVAEAYMWRLALSLLILDLCGLATWSTDIISTRLIMLFLLLLIMMVLRIVVHSTVPAIAYLTIIDHYTIFSFLFIFFLIVETAVMGIHDVYNDSIDGYFFYGFLGFFILMQFWFISLADYAVSEEKKKINQCTHELEHGYEDNKYLKTYPEFSIDATRDYEACHIDPKVISRKYF